MRILHSYQSNEDKLDVLKEAGNTTTVDLKKWVEDPGLTASTQSRRTKAHAEVPRNPPAVTDLSMAQ